MSCRYIEVCQPIGPGAMYSAVHVRADTADSSRACMTSRAHDSEPMLASQGHQKCGLFVDVPGLLQRKRRGGTTVSPASVATNDGWLPQSGKHLIAGTSIQPCTIGPWTVDRGPWGQRASINSVGSSFSASPRQADSCRGPQKARVPTSEPLVPCSFTTARLRLSTLFHRGAQGTPREPSGGHSPHYSQVVGPEM
jgi:hypothetical protein